MSHDTTCAHRVMSESAQSSSTEQKKPACLAREVKSKVGQLSDATDEHNRVAQVLGQNLWGIHAL